MRHGKGTIIYPDESIYKGNMVKDKREGYGVYNSSNGDYYDGNWLDDMS